MTQAEGTKKYPLATPEISRMLGIGTSQSHESPGVLNAYEKTSLSDLPISNLPVVEKSAHAEPPAHSHVDQQKNEHSEPAKTSPVIKVAKIVLPYAAVFAIGLLLYYYFFSATDFGSILKSRVDSAPKQTALEQLMVENSDAYKAWMSRFYYDISDAKVIDVNADNSGNGLSNFEKYLLNLNPKSYDTLGLGLADSQAIAAGINPLSGASLTDAQKQVVEKYIDMEVVMNRLALNNLRNPSQVAGERVNNGLNIRGNYQPNYEPVVSNPPLSNVSQPNALNSEVDIDMGIPGRLEIPSLNVNAPIMWSTSEKDFLKDLQSGVIHYPGTAVPGQIGTTYISGHSSNYLWAKGNFNKVFSHLGDLPNNASFKITVVQKNGKDAIFNYIVTGKKEFSPTDPEQFKNTGKSTVALSTCWPVGSTAKRLVVFAELIQVQN